MVRICNECSILWKVLMESFENGILKLHACVDDRRKKSEFILDSIKNEFFFLFLQRKNKIKLNFLLGNRQVGCLISVVFFCLSNNHKVEQKRIGVDSCNDFFSLFNFQGQYEGV